MRQPSRLHPSLLATAWNLARGPLAWLWLGSTLVALLGALPWLELPTRRTELGVAALAYALTLSGVGPDYFIRRIWSPGWQQRLRQLARRVRALSWWLAVAAVAYGLLFCFCLVVTGGYAFFLLYPVEPLFREYRSDYQGQVLFEQGRRQLVLRRGQLVVRQPLAAGFTLVADLPPGALDSTWTATTRPTPPHSYRYPLAGLPGLQAQLLATARHERLLAAENRRRQARLAAEVAARQATEQALGFDVLRFDLDYAENTFREKRSGRQLRAPLDSLRSGYAQLGPAGEFRFTTNDLTGGTESLTLVVAPFRGVGTYRLAASPGNPGPASTMQLRRYGYTLGVREFSSRPAQPPTVTITRFDPGQRVVEGTFEGRLYDPDGAEAGLRDGFFSLRFQAGRIGAG